ncbi:MAG: hypothetical protein U5L95_04115 [Candidatus Saccharibacteria bacterium]|nr:hypothetical protein [Candidatus Saccharibacteria bacterium]
MSTINQKQLDTALRSQTDEITDLLQTFMQQTDTRFNNIEAQISQLNEFQLEVA